MISRALVASTLVGSVAQLQSIKQARKDHLADEENARGHNNVYRGYIDDGATYKEWDQRFGTWSSAVALLLGGRLRRRLRKLEKRSPAMAVAPTKSPVVQAKPTMGAVATVAAREATISTHRL